MSDPRDELEVLRDLWQRLEAPPLDRPLEDEDEETRAAVLWMQDAWASLEPELVIRPAARPAPRRLERARPWLASVAAAAVLVSFSVAILRMEVAPPPSTEVAEATPPILAEPPVLVEQTDGAVSLRSGPVTLVWVGD